MAESADPAAAVAVVAVDDGASDEVAIEAPLELRIGGKAQTVLMRTPGCDDELVRGFLFTEGIIGAASEVIALERPAGLSGDERGNVVVAILAATVTTSLPERLFYSSSSCGVCGKTSIAQLAVRAAARPPGTADLRVRHETLWGLPEALRAAQPIFARTGGVHASGLFSADGRLECVREDVGRHNALDKVIGWALGARPGPLADRGLVVSGRVSFEIMQKAIAAGLPIVAAVGAPSSLAVDLAEQFDVTLIGFLRVGRMHVYSGGWRLEP
jgi:FdhD protein